MCQQIRSPSIIADEYSIVKKTPIKLLSNSDGNIPAELILEAAKKLPRFFFLFIFC